jgi:hypothetical protein
MPFQIINLLWYGTLIKINAFLYLNPMVRFVSRGNFAISKEIIITETDKTLKYEHHTNATGTKNVRINNQ